MLTSHAEPAGRPPGAVLFVDFDEGEAPQAKRFHGAKRVEGRYGSALEFSAALQYAEIDFSGKLDGIDSFILHRHVDHKDEGGLLLGLRGLTPNATEARPKKKSWEVLRAADTPEWAQAFEFALPIIGKQSWDEGH